jgi:hypothetical protein
MAIEQLENTEVHITFNEEIERNDRMEVRRYQVVPEV